MSNLVKWLLAAGQGLLGSILASFSTVVTDLGGTVTGQVDSLRTVAGEQGVEAPEFLVVAAGLTLVIRGLNWLVGLTRKDSPPTAGLRGGFAMLVAVLGLGSAGVACRPAAASEIRRVSSVADLVLDERRVPRLRVVSQWSLPVSDGQGNLDSLTILVQPGGMTAVSKRLALTAVRDTTIFTGQALPPAANLSITIAVQSWRFGQANSVNTSINFATPVPPTPGVTGLTATASIVDAP